MTNKQRKKLNQKILSIIKFIDGKRVSNDYNTLLKIKIKAPDIKKVLEEFLRFEIKLKEEKQLIENINYMLYSYFMEFQLVSELMIVGLPEVGIILFDEIYEISFLNNLKKFESNFSDSSSSFMNFNGILIIITWLIKKNEIVEKSMGNRDLKNDLIKLFSDFIDFLFTNKQIDEDENIKRGHQTLLIINMCILDLTLSEMLGANIKVIQPLTIILREYSKIKNYKILSRIFEMEIIKSIWGKRTIGNVYHYTSLEGLSSILSSSSFKFTKIDNLNDENEGTLLGRVTKGEVFSASFSRTSDSLALFGEYTKHQGISIEFDLIYMMNSINSLYFFKSSGNYVSRIYFPPDLNYISYDNEPLKKINILEKEITKMLQPLVDVEFISRNIEYSKSYIEYFFKNTPWSYEQEYRIAFNIPSTILEDKKQSMHSGYIKNNDIFLYIKPKNLFKKIILGPKISQNKNEIKKINQILNEHMMETLPIEKTNSRMKLKKQIIK